MRMLQHALAARGGPWLSLSLVEKVFSGMEGRAPRRDRGVSDARRDKGLNAGRDAGPDAEPDGGPDKGPGMGSSVKPGPGAATRFDSELRISTGLPGGRIVCAFAVFTFC